MIRPRELLLLFALAGTPVCLLGESAPKGDRTAGDSSTLSFEAFSIVVGRNIFNADRRGLQVTTQTVERPPDERIVLVGALINHATTGTEIVAFFEGSKREYETTAKPGDTIAEWRVTQVRTDGVTLDKEGLKTVLPVGSALSRPAEGGEWKVVAFSGSFADRQTDTRTRSQTSAESSIATDREKRDSGDAAAGDVLKRLMERRRKETGR